MANEGTRGVTPELRHQRHESRAGSTYKTFLKDLVAGTENLGQGLRLDEGRAERAAVSILCAIERRILSEEAHQLTAQLPFKLRELVQRCELHKGDKPEKFGRKEFYEVIASDLEMSVEDVEPVVRAVVATLRKHVTEGEIEDVASQLPGDLKELWLRPS